MRHLAREMHGGWLSSVAVVLALGSARGEVLLHIPLDGSLEPNTAREQGKVVFTPPAGQKQAKPEFAEGILGQALSIGSGCRVSYVAKANLRGDRGTLTFWARRIGPKPDQRYTFHLAGWNNADRTWVRVYRWQWHTGVNMLHGRGGSGDVGLQLPGDADDGAWHMFAFTWDGPKARGYLDGQTDARAERLDFPPGEPVQFWLGGGDGTGRLIDDVTVFDEPLSTGEIKAMYRAVMGAPTQPTLAVPRRRADVRIDGRIGAEEWAGAAESPLAVEAASGRSPETPTSVRVMYDDEALYVAFHSPLPEKVARDPAMTAGMTGILRQTQDKHDGDLGLDDCVEVLFAPRPTRPAYRLAVNGLNTHYDASISFEGEAALSWNPAWESACALDTEGWQVELRIPFSAFDAPPPRPGDRWGMNFARTWKALQTGRDVWRAVARGEGAGQDATATVLFAAPEAPVVRLHGWGRLADNALELRGTVFNPGQHPWRGRWTLASDSAELRETETIEVAPGGAAGIRVSHPIQEPATGMLRFEVCPERAGAAPLFRSEAPVSVSSVLEIRAAHYPTAGVFKILVDAGRLRSTPLAELSLSVTLADAENRPVLAPTRLRPLPGYTCAAELKVADLAPAKYQAQCVVEHNGKAIGAKRIPLDKQPLPEWYDNRIGVTDAAPKPFTPVQRRGDGLACWGREYRYEERLFPVQISTQGRPLLAGPIELVLTDAEGRRTSSIGSEAEARWGRHTDFRADFARRGRLAGLDVQTESWLECDGFLWTTLRIDRLRPGDRRLVVRVPLRKEESGYINPYDYSTASTGRLAANGWQGTARPLWLGSPTAGFQFTTETMAGARLAPDSPELRVVPEADRNVLEIALVDRPGAEDPRAGEPLEVSWGWIATPVRPPTPGYRGWLTGNCDLMPGYQWYVPRGTDFDPRWLRHTRFIGHKPRPDGQGESRRSAGPYVVTSRCPADMPEFVAWGDEWSPSQAGRRTEGRYGVCSVGAASWVDYLVWCYSRLYDRGRYLGLYYDCAPHLPDDNRYHGAGLDQAGKPRPTHPVLGARRVAQRLYAMLRQREPDQTMIVYHHSGGIDMAFLSWCDAYADGENFTSRLNKREQDYHRVFPVDAFLAQSMGHNFGLTVWLLDEFNRSGATSAEDWGRLGVQPVTHFYGLVLLHDSTYWKAYGNPEGYRLVDEALRKYQFDDRYRMVPYWSQKIVALPERVYATFYVDPGARRVLAVFLNNNEEDVLLRLDADWRALGFQGPDGLTVDDAVFGRGARLEDGRLVVPVGRANMRLVAIGL